MPTHIIPNANRRLKAARTLVVNLAKIKAVSSADNPAVRNVWTELAEYEALLQPFADKWLAQRKAVQG